MTDVLFYDFDFNLIADFPRTVSINFTKKYCGYGTAEIHFSLAETGVITLLEENPYLLFVSGGNWAVVTGWRIGEDIAVFGRTPEWLLTKRGVPAFSRSGMTGEEIAMYAVSIGADFVTLGEKSGVGTARNYSTGKVRVLYDVVCEILEPQSLGFKLTPDIVEKQFVFTVYSGKESLCLISQSNRTAYGMEYTVEKEDMVTNSGWYEQKFTNMGKWDAYSNLPSLSDNQSANAYQCYEITSDSYDSNGKPVNRFGLWCQKGWYLYSDDKTGKWKITDVKPDTVWKNFNNSAQTGAKRWDAVLSGTKTEQEALAEVARLKRKNETESETKNIKYGTDYSLGDVVRVQTEIGDFKKTERKRVVSVDIYYDIDKIGVTPIFSSLEE